MRSAKRTPRQCMQVLPPTDGRMPASSLNGKQASIQASEQASEARAEEGSTALRGPARLVEQPVRHRPRHPGRDLPAEGLCASEPRQAGRQGRQGGRRGRTLDDKGEKPQTGCCQLVGWHGILAWRVGLPKEAVRLLP